MKDIAGIPQGAKAALMACPNGYSAETASITTSKSQKRPSSGKSVLSGINSRPAHFNASSSKKSWARNGNESPLLDRSSDGFNDSNDSLSSSSKSDSSPFAGGRGRRSMFSGDAILRQMPGKRQTDTFGNHKNNAHSKPPFKMGSHDDTPAPTSAKLEKHDGSHPVLPFQRPDLLHRSTFGPSNSTSHHVPRPRQAPRTYTSISQPPFGDSDDSEDSDPAESEPVVPRRSSTFHSSTRAQAPRLSLQINDGSSAPLHGISQTTATGRSSFGYARDNGSALDSPSPMSRSSLDFVFRSKPRTSVDPMSRAATVQAARQAFEEKEEAKSRKFELQQIKAEEKQTRRKEKQHWRTSMRDDELHLSTPDILSEKPSVDDTPDPATAPPQPAQPTTLKTWKSQSKNTWMLFITWLRTRVFKLGRKVRNVS